ncbi:MAG: hypothetical protein DI601_18340 [Azospirillum brasilense]|nr:MAG: hypothetical protein DI601_18340 [Azospirillum brasilense]
MLVGSAGAVAVGKTAETLTDPDRRSVRRNFRDTAEGPLTVRTPPATEAAFLEYDAVQARRPEAEGDDDDATNRWCAAEIAAIQALADAPAGGVEALLRMVLLLGDRYERDAHWNLMDCEADLILAMRDQARVMLREG